MQIYICLCCGKRDLIQYVQPCRDCGYHNASVDED